MRVSVPDLLHRLGVRVASRGGARLWARCPHPDHDDRDPSWYIIDDPQDRMHGRHHCYGCGWGGWPVHLASAVLDLPLREARAWVREGASAPAPTSVSVEVLPTAARFSLPSGVRFGPLNTWPTPARRYARGRGLTPGQVARWGVGYCVEGKLAGRVVFPVRSGAGEVVGYVARTFVGARVPHRTPDKRDGADLGAVYGEQHWPPPPERAVVRVTEAVIDALAVERAEPGPIGAVLGSSLHPSQVGRLSTFQRVVVVSDGDEAGDKLAEDLAAQLARWCEVLRAPVPRGLDCAKLERRDVGVLRRVLHSAR